MQELTGFKAAGIRLPAKAKLTRIASCSRASFYCMNQSVRTPEIYNRLQLIWPE